MIHFRLHEPFQVRALESELKSLTKNMDKVRGATVESIVKTLPEEQQPLVQACFEAAKHQNKKGRRYTTSYIYDCIIMRVKPSGLYEELRIENKLALPSPRTLLRYLKALRPAFGFQDNVFTMMERKAQHIPAGERRGKNYIKFPSLVSVTNGALYTYYQKFSGCLLLDEMAVQKLPTMTKTPAK